MKKIICILIACLLLSPINGFSIDYPILRSWVNDYIDVLNNSETQELDAILKDFENNTSSQIFVAIMDQIPSGTSLEKYVSELFDHWKPGKKEKNNGVLLAIFIKDRKLRLEVGYGLEGELTNTVNKHIINNDIVPDFKQGNYYGGIKKGIQSIILTILTSEKPKVPIEPYTTIDKELLKAIEESDVQAVQNVLQQGANPNTRVTEGSLKGLTALMLAVAGGYLQTVQLLLEYKADVKIAITEQDYQGVTALMIAIGEGNTEIVKLLLEHNADVNMAITEKGFKGVTPLMIAAGYLSEQGNVEIAKLLLEHNADINATLKALEENVYVWKRKPITEVLIKAQQERESEQQLTIIKSTQSANELYVMGYKHEKTNTQIAVAAYQEILERFPESDVAIKAIDRLDKMEKLLRNVGAFEADVEQVNPNFDAEKRREFEESVTTNIRFAFVNYPRHTKENLTKVIINLLDRINAEYERRNIKLQVDERTREIHVDILYSISQEQYRLRYEHIPLFK